MMAYAYFIYLHELYIALDNCIKYLYIPWDCVFFLEEGCGGRGVGE